MQDISSEKYSKILRPFKRDPSVEILKDPKPRRVVYVKSPRYYTELSKLSRGQSFAENITAHWEDHDNSARFERTTPNSLFRFDKSPNPYFSISWALGEVEIDMLTSNRQICVSFADVTNVSGRPIKTNMHGRINHIYGSNHLVFDGLVTPYLDRYYLGWSLHDKEVKFDQAYRLWIDFIIEAPNSRTIMLHDPLLLIQDRLVF